MEDTQKAYRGNDKMLLGIVLGVLNFWLFAQTLVNMVPQVQFGLGISPQLMSLAISVTALFSGLFIVAAGNLADMVGRKKLPISVLYLASSAHYFWSLP